MRQLKVKRMHENVKLPTYGTDGAGAIDFYNPCDCMVPIGKGFIYGLGIAVELAKDEVLLIVPRSSTGVKTPLRVSNSMGVIDSDYRGEIAIVLDNECEPYKLKKGERIAQGLIIKIDKYEIKEVDELSETKRGGNGFGHTGK